MSAIAKFLGLLSTGILAAAPISSVAPSWYTDHTAVALDVENSYSSANWAGYAAVGGSFTSPTAGAVSSVSATWTVPAATGTAGTKSYSSIWVGIDGMNVPGQSAANNTVEQVGTEQDVSATGVPSYYAWFEMYPTTPYQMTTVPIHPGDQVTASVNYLGTVFAFGATQQSFSFTVDDLTTGQTATVNSQKAYSPYGQSGSTATRSSAEWIVEDPTSTATGHPLLPFSHLGTVTFSNATATISGATVSPISSFTHSAITLQTTGVPTTTIASASALSGGGEVFTVTQVPEPAGYALATALGLGWFAWFRRASRR